MRSLTQLLRISCVLIAFFSALPQTREKRIKPFETDRAQQFSKADTVGVAVLVGVGKYPRYSGLSELHYPAVDVDTLAATLKKQRYLVLTLKDSDATRESVLNAISQAGEALAGENLTAIFFFSGHGFAVNGENYLATLDASVNKLAQTGLSVKVVEQALTKTQAARRVMWIDACRDEAGKGVESRSFANLQESAGTRMLLSTKAGKVSYEDEELRQGVFSYYLVKGLQGDAAGPDGLVTFQDLSFYVTQQVRARSLETGHVQVPYEAGEASGDFLIARSAAEGGSPVAAAAPVTAVIDNTPKPGSVKTNAQDKQRYVWIAAGSFIMGCSPGDSECFPQESPAHNVSITKGFWLGQTAVKVEAWKRYVAAKGLQMPPEPKALDKELNSGWRDEQQPVVNVTWDEAKGYCEWVGGRLPTEAEWEYAARAGSADSRYGNLDDIAWYGNNSGSQMIDSAAIWQSDGKNYFRRIVANGDHIHPVGQKAPNGWKLYDMLGNVWQWTADWYGEKYYDQREGSDPQGPPGGDTRVVRGHPWYGSPREVRVSFRHEFGPERRRLYIGLRCVGG